MDPRARFSIDRGGTFTDVYAELVAADGSTVLKQRVLKLLSQNPHAYEDAPREGIRRVLEEFFEIESPRDQLIDTRRILEIRMGTTVATNALLERKGERFALLTTEGLRDIWHIGNQSRPDIFDLAISCPETLYERVVELDERVILASEDADAAYPGLPRRAAVTGEEVLVERALDLDATRAKLKALRAEGFNSIAVALMHAALYPEHELAVGRLARELGFSQVSLSHEVMQMVKIVPRGYTTSADAYLTPHIGRYLETFQRGFDADLLKNANVSFMQSDGGLTNVARFSGHRAILSGPAGGVVGYALTSSLAARPAGERAPPPGKVVGFDMGGTSTDVSRFAGEYEHVFETTTAGVTIQAPQLDISTVAAGGGSKLVYQSGVFKVGPESVGAHPGPVCYRKGGDLAVTDANVVLGRVLPAHFPHIFGPNEDQPLDAEGSRAAFARLAAAINADAPDLPPKSPEEIAFGFARVANEAMCRPIRNLTQMRGYDLEQHSLACFGGAGGQHACAIARALGMSRVFVHRYSGILSAFGIGLADVVEDVQEPCALRVPTAFVEGDRPAQGPALHAEALEEGFRRLEDQAAASLEAQGADRASLRFQYFVNCRYHGTDTGIMAAAEARTTPLAAFLDTFLREYEREFGFRLRNRDVVLDDLRVRASAVSGARARQDREAPAAAAAAAEAPAAPPLETARVYFEGGWRETPVYKLASLADGGPALTRVEGPAILLDPNSTLVIEPDCVAFVSAAGDVTIDLLPREGEASRAARSREAPKRADPIQLSLLSHRFMGIAEQMGRTLQRTSVSVNIKERLDFSCALFGPDGGLVANAPHIPVHLGAMQEAIRFQHERFRAGGLDPGDVLVSNHPQLAGGSHLPDITVITPCFEGSELVFWVASRGHHADVGGITPGSMPPHSTTLKDEGAAIVSFKLVRAGTFQEEGISEVLLTPSNPDDPACSGTRALPDCLSDLRAQVAANNHGVRLLGDLVREYGLPVVQAYMRFIQENAAGAVRDMLLAFVKRIGKSTVQAHDFMDDGTVIQLEISVDSASGDAVFSFEGTGPQVLGNCNAPPAITYSAIIYALRCLVGQDIPLNQGCLAPITVRIPERSILNPAPESAVVGGNVLTSQRVVDVILKAFNASAASQGCMNNLTFGDKTFGYYETIAGGAGAGPTWEGRSGVHTHMTNTRITDPEILERRYPVLLRRFGLRPGTGGAGAHRGGDGVEREIEFLRPVTVSILSERRALAPFGLAGGHDGARGENLLLRRPPGAASAEIYSLGGKRTVAASALDRVRILSPGGGGYGAPTPAK